MFRTGFVLLHHDALLPKETAHHVPPIPRFFMGVLRTLFARKTSLRPGERYALAFQELGPAFIKLGQVLSTRSATARNCSNVIWRLRNPPWQKTHP